MKILVAVELKVPDSPVLVTQVDMKTPKTESEELRAAVAFMDTEERIIEQSITLTKYQMQGKKKKLKSIRCPHCKFNYSMHGKMMHQLGPQLASHRNKLEILRCSECGKLYTVKQQKNNLYVMEW
jgi:uncharacterized protein with PIN domain